MTNCNALPRITIVTPSFNQASFLETTIRSVLDQGYPNLEYIIMDGGSTDGSVEIIKRYAGHLAYWQSQPDGGQAAAINAGFARATGEIFGWLNSDDWYDKETLRTIGSHFASNPQSQWCVGDGVYQDLRHYVNIRLSPKKLDFASICQWPENALCQPAAFWRRSLFEQAGCLNPELHCTMDFDLWLRFAKIVSGTIIPQTLAYASLHPAAKTQTLKARTFVEICLCLDRHGAHSLATRKLERVARRAFMVDNLFSFITRNPLYRRWRERRESPSPGNERNS